MDSKRFPGKAMYLFNGKPTLKYLIESLTQYFNKSQLCIATSIEKNNDLIREFADKNNISVYSGDEDNVASRFVDILKKRDAEHFIRICGDSPLMDCKIIKNALQNIDGNYDLYSTIYTERFPAGMNFEIIKKNTFLNEYPNFSEERHFEHVTEYFYDNSYKFSINQIKNVIKYPEKYDFSFDTAEDKLRISKIINSMKKPHYSYSLIEKSEIYNKCLKSEL